MVDSNATAPESDDPKRTRADDGPVRQPSVIGAILRTLEYQLHLPFFWKNLELTYEWANFAYAQTLGRRVEEVVGQRDEDLFPTEVARLRTSDDQEVLKAARVQTVRFQRAIGGVVHIRELFRIPVLDSSGKAVGLLGVERDVTTQAAAIADLELSRLLLEVLMNTLPDSIYFKDAQSRFLRTNKATAVKFGLQEPEDVVGKTDFDLFSQEHAQEAYVDEQRIIATQIPIIGKEEKETWPDGRVSWVSTTKVPVFGADGNILGTFGITRDVTLRKNAQIALEQSEHKYRELIENANDIIYTHDMQGTMLSLNKSAERATGYRLEEAPTLRVQDLVAPEHRDLATEMTRQKLQGVPTTTYELDILSKDGHRIPLEVSTRVLLDGERPVAIQGIARDITERKRAQDALQSQARLLAEQARRLESQNDELAKAYRNLQEAETQLIHSEKMAAIGQLVAGLAHEINNPAAFVLTNLTTIERDVADLLDYIRACESLLEQSPAIQPRLTEIQKEISVLDAAEEVGKLLASARTGMHRIRDLVSNLRSYSHIDSRATLEIADLSQGIESTLVLLRPMVPRGVSVDVRYAEVPAVECNVGPINQVFMNLIMNAIQAVGDAGNVWIETKREHDGVIVQVRDDGPGVPESIVRRIFDPFFTTKEVGKGTGLGLTICQRITDAHHGRLEVESSPGQGATFRVWLPLRQPHELGEPDEI